MRISDWSSDVCSSDLSQRRPRTGGTKDAMTGNPHPARWALAALWRLTLAAIQAVLVWSGLAMAALVFLQVIIRYFTIGSVYGIADLALSLAFWFYLFGAAPGPFMRSQHRLEKRAVGKEVGQSLWSG